MTDELSPAPATRWRWLLAAVVDLLLPLALIVAGVVAMSGGGTVSLYGLRVSASGPGRALLVALVLLLVRLLVTRTVPWPTPPLAWIGARITGRYDRRADAPDPVSPDRQSVWLPMAGLAGVTLLLLWPQLRDMHAVPDFGDPFFSIWRIGWVQAQLHGDPRPLFDANIFYPEPLTFTYSDSMLLPGLAAAPLLALGLTPVVTYNLLLIAGFVLSGAAMFLLARALTGSTAAAFVAAVIFGFYPYRFEHYSHLELQMTQWMPLALLAAHRFLQTRQWRFALAAALCGVAQLYSSMYYAVFFTLYAAVVLGVLVLLARPPLRRLLAPAVVAAVLAVALAVPLAKPYAESTAVKGERSRDEVEIYSAVPSDYFRAQYRSVPYRRQLLPDRQPERALFPGVAALTLAAVGAIPPLGPVRLAYLAGLAVAVDGSLGFNGLSWSALYDHSSVIRGLRAPARFSILTGLTLALLAAFGAQRLFGHVRRPAARRALFTVVVGLTLLDLRSALALIPVWPEPPPIYAAVAGRQDVVLAEFPMSDDYGLNTPFLYFSLWHWAPMVNGYSGFLPASYVSFQKQVASFPESAAFDAMRLRGVTHVTVNCGLYRGPCDGLLAAIDARPDVTLTASGRWRNQPVRLYRLEPR